MAISLGRMHVCTTRLRPWSSCCTLTGVRESAIRDGMIEPRSFEQGVKDLYRTTEPDGVFCYTFFKAIGVK